MKYIDADKLIAEIDRRMENYNATIEKYCGKQKSIKAERDSWKWAECKWFRDLIASLQQEQQDKYETALERAREWMPNVNQGGHAILIDIFPELGEGLDPRYGGRKQEQPEVDLEKEIDKEWENCGPVDEGMGYESALLISEQFHQIARHFYKLGKNAR